MRDLFDFSDPETQLAVALLMWLTWVMISGGVR